MLITKCKQANLSQSDFFRMLIQDYSENKILKNKDIDEARISLSNISDNLTKLSNELNRLYYYDFVNFLNTQISNIRKIIYLFQK